MANKRKSISKKLRFEVFKRDGFTCQYCGETPPKAVLEVDHIIPVSKGGEHDINNFATSCFSCNRGKSNIPIEKISPSISESADLLRKKEDQIKEYRKFIAAIRRRKTRDTNKINAIFVEYFPGRQLSDNFKRLSIGRFLEELPLHEVEDAMDIACSRIDDSEDAVKYFCGICWKKIRGESE